MPQADSANAARHSNPKFDSLARNEFILLFAVIDAGHCTHLFGDEKVATQNQDLKDAGLKVTLPRVKILQMFATNDSGHLSAEDIYKALQETGEDVGLATVYRVLTQFEAAGLITKHNFDGTHAIYELATDDHHDHMINIKTGEVIEFVDSLIEQRQHQIAAEHGLTIVGHSLVLYVKKAE